MDDAREYDRKAELLAWCTHAFALRGAEVIVRDGDANWIRRRIADEGGGYEVVVAGLPNLLHELAHAAQCDALADDHGFDYNLIPLRLERAEERRYLWEELAAAVLSCAYLGDGQPTIDAWFAEQIEIQGVFYGVDDDLDALRALIDHALGAHAAEAEVTVERAYSACAGWLRGAGAPVEVAEARYRYTAQELWGRYLRARASGHRQCALRA